VLPSCLALHAVFPAALPAALLSYSRVTSCASTSVHAAAFLKRCHLCRHCHLSMKGQLMLKRMHHGVHACCCLSRALSFLQCVPSFPTSPAAYLPDISRLPAALLPNSSVTFMCLNISACYFMFRALSPLHEWTIHF
jgi:hypothetical protein